MFGFELGFGEKLGTISSPMCNWIDIVQFWEYEDLGIGRKRDFLQFYFFFA